VRVHTEMEGAQPPVHEEAVEWAGDRAHRVLDEPQPLMPLRGAGDHRPADHVGVAAQVLGRGVDDEVRAELERALVGRRGERVVDRHQRAPAPRHHPCHVDHVEQRVGRGLDPDQSRLVPYGAFERMQVGLVDEVELKTPPAEDLVDEPVCAAVQIRRGPSPCTAAHRSEPAPDRADIRPPAQRSRTALHDRPPQVRNDNIILVLKRPVVHRGTEGGPGGRRPGCSTCRDRQPRR
jgi:hypothetical protein